jgi:UDP-glucuronate decarboxylase
MMAPEQTSPGPINLGNPKEFTMLELAQMVLKLSDSDSQIVFQDLPEDDPKQRRPDISRAQGIGWAPKIELEEGLQKTVKFFSRRLSLVL